MQLDSTRLKRHKYYLAKQILENNNINDHHIESNKNIFTEPQNPAKGPKFNRKKIIQHSFVGKEEWLKNYVNNQRSKRNLELFRSAARKIIMKSKLRLLNKQQDQVVNSFKNILKKNNSKVMAPKEKEKKEFKNAISMKNVCSQQDIQMHYNSAQERIKSNMEKDQKKLLNMDFEIRQYLMRDLKVLENHDKFEKHWQLFSSKSCKKLNRNASQLDQVYDYRFKKEQQINIDNLISHYDNRQTKFRMIHQEPQIPIIFSQVQERNVQGQVLTEPILQNLEIIRKPKIPLRGYSSFKSQNAFEQQLQKLKSEISEDHSIIEELEMSKSDLVVEGKSQLELEKSMINQEGYFTGILKSQNQKIEDEVLAQSYDWRHFYSK